VKSTNTFSIQPSMRVWTWPIRVSSAATLPTVRIARVAASLSTVANLTPISCWRSGEILMAPGGTAAVAAAEYKIFWPVVAVGVAGSSA
jgi:hypothetical protein